MLSVFATMVQTTMQFVLITNYNKIFASSMLKLHSELSFTNASKSNFLSTVGHEIRTPLTAIQGAADLLLYSIKCHGHGHGNGTSNCSSSHLVQNNDKEQIAYLNIILAASKTLMNSMNNMLQYLKYESTRTIPFVEQPCNISKIIKNMYNIMRIKIHKEKGLGFTWKRVTIYKNIKY